MFQSFLGTLYILSNTLTGVKKTTPMEPSQTLFFVLHCSHMKSLIRNTLFCSCEYFLEKGKRRGCSFFLSQDILSHWILFFPLTEKKTTLLRVLMLLVLLPVSCYDLKSRSQATVFMLKILKCVFHKE